jgi:hypothetical protein
MTVDDMFNIFSFDDVVQSCNAELITINAAIRASELW